MMENRGHSELDICDINDIRNGLLLNKILHKIFGLGEVAFLMVRITIIRVSVD